MNRTSSAIAVETWVPLISASPSLGPSTSGSSPSRASASPAGSVSPPSRISPSPSRAALEMGERREIARGADRALAPGSPASASASSKASSRSTTIAAARRYGRGRGRSPSATMDQPHDPAASSGSPSPQLCERMRLRLQLRQPVVGDAGLGEQAEAGIDAIDGAPARQDPADAGRGGVDRGPGVVGERDRRAVPDRAQLGEGDRAGIESDRSSAPPSADRAPARARSRSRSHSPHRHGASRRCRGRSTAPAPAAAPPPRVPSATITMPACCE